MDVDATVKRRKYSPGEVKQQTDHTHSRVRVNLGLAFTCFRALKERLGMESNVELACFMLIR